MANTTKQDERPVWEKANGENIYFFYTKSINKWYIGPNTKRASGGIKSSKTDGNTIPNDGWLYYNQGQWNQDDESLKIKATDHVSDEDLEQLISKPANAVRLQDQVKTIFSKIQDHPSFGEFLHVNFFDNQSSHLILSSKDNHLIIL